MANEQQKRRNLECRYSVREYLADRPGLALRSASIVAGLRHDGAYTSDEVNAALEFLLGWAPHPHVTAVNDEDGGGERYWKITTAGTRFYENGS